MLGKVSLIGGQPRRVLIFGGSGTAGQGALRALVAAGHEVTCVLRVSQDLPVGVREIIAEVALPLQISDHFDVVVSCIASRTGTPKDAWAIDHDAQLNILTFAQTVGVSQFILLSAICLQKPKLPFQYAKLAFEEALICSGLDFSIVRPTAFFKSLSGQLDRVRANKPFLVFGDGKLTACKPISDDDLGQFIADCIDNPLRRNQILPIGGPGPAITPLDQAEGLFGILDQPLKVRRLPVGLIFGLQTVLGVIGWVFPKIQDKAELMRIGYYYATESMLFLNEETGRYDADATPSTGSETLFDYYKELIVTDKTVQRGDHSVF